MGAKAETVFGNEIRKSIMTYANEQGMPPPVILKMHGSVTMSNVPDLLVMTSRGSFFMELKVRKTPPKKKFNLFSGVTPGQMMMMLAIAESEFPVILATRITRNMTIIIPIAKDQGPVEINPKEGSLLPGRCFRLDKIKGLWREIVQIFELC